MTECFLRSVDQLFQALSTDFPEYQLTGGIVDRGGRGCPHSIDQLTLRTESGNDIIKNLEDPDMYTSVEDRQVKQRMLDLQEKLIMKRALELLRTSNMNDGCKEESKQNLLHFTRAVTSNLVTARTCSHPCRIYRNWWSIATVPRQMTPCSIYQTLLTSRAGSATKNTASTNPFITLISGKICLVRCQL